MGAPLRKAPGFRWEWSAVSVLNGVDGCLPSNLATGSEMEIEEERRLLCVGMAHAKDQLDLIIPQRFCVCGQSATGDRHVYASRTRFIPNRLLAHFEARSGRWQFMKAPQWITRVRPRSTWPHERAPCGAETMVRRRPAA